MLTISQVARRFGLSRSTLLYYDSIGLLSPSARSRANYRLYSEADVERMELIDLYRQAGLPLKDVARVLDGDRGTAGDLLAERLRELGREINTLRRQQRRIVDLLKTEAALRETRSLDKEGWVAILRATERATQVARAGVAEYPESSILWWYLGEETLRGRSEGSASESARPSHRCRRTRGRVRAGGRWRRRFRAASYAAGRL